MKATFALTVVAALLCSDSLAQRRTRILIDASKDGGTWWAPQHHSGFDPRAAHQGKALADFLRRKGADVEELPTRAVETTAEQLNGRDLVIRAGTGGNSDVRVNVLGVQYPGGEIGAYRDYVAAGGKLLLLSEYKRPGYVDGLTDAFGIRLAGMSTGDNRIDRFVSHPLTRNVRDVPYLVGSAIVGAASEKMLLLGFLSKRTYLDMNGDRRKNPGEPEGAAVLGVLEFGRGVVVFLGDVNTLQRVPQPLTDNIYNFLVSSDKGSGQSPARR
jgi:hypothetical protein